MNLRFTAFAGALLLAATAAAQESDTSAIRQEMTSIAAELLASVEGPSPTARMLGIDARAKLAFPFDDEQRENWQYWPTARIGLPLENMNAAQRRLVHDLLTSALGSNGYLKVTHIMQLEEILDVLDEAGLPRSVDHYVLAVFGTPATDAPWGWRFEGHHVSLNVTVAPDALTVTPSFLGSNPAEVVSGPLAGFRVHGVVEDLARELLMSLSDAQRSRAIVADRPPGEIFTANINKERSQWDAWRETLEPEGVPVADLNEVQQHWVRLILDEVIGNYRSTIAEAHLREIDPRDLSFAWMGSAERRAPHYFRLQGGDFVFEYDNVQNQGNHVHSVWRSPSLDFGRDVLGEHYRTSHAR